jgi:2-C-methyl-D-erythritol 2,4-cyclodiphosphate synthase
MRIGLGYDIHRFGEGRTLILGGVEFPGERGLDGHSDADVLLHAVIDALLGAAGLGDIGVHFPPGDPEWAGASSAGLLDWTGAMLRERGFSVESVDSTVIAERPRLAERLPAMRERIASVLGISADRVNVKATTNEGLGAIGRGEGIAAMAVALLSAGSAT